MDRKKELEGLIKEKQEEIENFELDPDEYEGDYQDRLNEQGEIKIGYLTFMPADIVKKLDPIAYDCWLNDFIDGLDIEANSGYKELVEELEELQDELQDIESKEDE